MNCEPIRCPECHADVISGEHAPGCSIGALFESIGARKTPGGIDTYILDEQHRPVPEANILRWGKWLETSDRIVKQEHIGPYFVSTIFLGLDHSPARWMRPELAGPPILFETMVFYRFGGQDRIETQQRCATWEDALAQHAEIVAKFASAANG